MPTSKDEARQKVAELVKKYQALSPSAIKKIDEANTKQAFIEPLFRALGWDVDDTDEVTLEENVSNKRVDYAFKLNGVSQFYLEAKPLKADLTNPDYIKQAVTYAYAKSVTWAVLTDFEKIAAYESQTGRPFLNLSCANFLTDFDDLWLFSKESFQANALSSRAGHGDYIPPGRFESLSWALGFVTGPIALLKVGPKLGALLDATIAVGVQAGAKTLDDNLPLSGWKPDFTKSNPWEGMPSYYTGYRPPDTSGSAHNNSNSAPPEPTSLGQSSVPDWGTASGWDPYSDPW